MECWHSRIHSGPSPSTFSAAEWHNADEVPRIVALQIFPPEESSSRVSIAGIFAPLSSSTDLCVMVYQFLVTFSQNRNLAYRKILYQSFFFFWGGGHPVHTENIKEEKNIKKMNYAWKIYQSIIAYFVFALYVDYVMSQTEYDENAARKGIDL